MPREPNPSVTPSRVTGRACGYAFQNHAGGTVVGVPRSTSMPAPASRSSTSSRNEKSYSPSRGSSSAHEKMPTLTRLTPASRMSSMSSSQVSRVHCSGL